MATRPQWLSPVSSLLEIQGMCTTAESRSRAFHWRRGPEGTASQLSCTARKCRNLARSGEVLAGLQGACACSERSHVEGAQSRLNRRGVGKRARLSWSGHVGSCMRPGVTPLVGAFSENHWATCQGLCEVTRICRGGKGSISGDPAVPEGHQSL